MNNKFIIKPKMRTSDDEFLTFELINDNQSVIISSSTNKIPSFAIMSIKPAKNIIFENSITEISILGVWDLDNLESITLPKNINLVEKRAFFECPNLKVIYIQMPKEEFILLYELHSENFEGLKPFLDKIVYVNCT